MNELWQLAFALLVFVVLSQAVGLLGLARAIGLLQLRLGPEPGALETADGLQLHVEAPALVGFDIRLKREVILDLRSGLWVMVFVSVTCGICRDLVKAAARVSKDLGHVVRVVVVSQGTHEQNELLRRTMPELTLLSDPEGRLLKLYQVERTPQSFLVEDSQVIAKGITNNRDQLEALIERRTTRLPNPIWRTLGSAAIEGPARAVSRDD